jgi:hypothetical protein
MHSRSVQGFHAPVVVAVIDGAAHGTQLAEHSQHQVLARVADLFVRDQSRGKQPVTRSHGLVCVVDQVFQLPAQVTHFVLPSLIACVALCGAMNPGETLKRFSPQGYV